LVPKKAKKNSLARTGAQERQKNGGDFGMEWRGVRCLFPWMPGERGARAGVCENFYPEIRFVDGTHLKRYGKWPPGRIFFPTGRRFLRNGHFMAIYPFREANPSSQKQKFVTDNFSGTLANSSRANPKIRPVFRSHKNTA
jgi:hypothetical protein